jgi:flavodoxin
MSITLSDSVILDNGEVKKLDVKGKNVAVFGLGDSVSYSDNYADATGELHDIFQTLGCNMMGYTSQEGYEHTASKSIRGDLFCGLLCDNVNQEELTPGLFTSTNKNICQMLPLTLTDNINTL